MPLTRTETIGFCSQVAQFSEENTANLQTQGLDVSNWITDLNTKRDTAIAKNAEQDDLRVQDKSKTAKAGTVIKDAYQTASTRLDAVIDTFGKTTALANKRLNYEARSTGKQKRNFRIRKGCNHL